MSHNEELNVMLSAYIQNGSAEGTLQSYKDMLQDGRDMSNVAYSSFLKPISWESSIEMVKWCVST